MYAFNAVSVPISMFTAAAPDAGLGLPAYILDLEAAHAALRRAAVSLQNETEPTVDLAPAARALKRALGAVYDAVDGRALRSAAVDTAFAQVVAAEAALGEGGLAEVREEMGRARRHLNEAASRLAIEAPRQPPSAAEIRASIETPVLHAVPRRSLVPALRVQSPPRPPPAPPAPIPLPRTFTELDDAVTLLEARSAAAMNAGIPAAPARAEEEAPPPAPALAGFTRDIGVAVDESAFLQARARECFEEVAMVDLQRTPQHGDQWRSSATLDRRMFAAIDLLAAMGPVVIDHVPRLFADAPVKDESHGFALAMVLGCFRGRDALAAAELPLFDSDRTPELVDEIGRAFKLVPHDGLATALHVLLREPDPVLRRMAVDVLGYRGLAPDHELAALTKDVPEVAAVAFRHLLAAPSPLLWPLLDDAGEPTDGELREAVWTALAVSGHPRAPGVLRAALRGDAAGEAALLLALAGDQEDARALVQRAVEAPTPSLVEAAGWSGAGWAIGPLVTLLKHDDEDIRTAAGAALDRITGAGLWEEVEVAEDDILVPEPSEPDIGEPAAPKLVQLVGDSRDPPPPPEPERVTRPATDPARWHAFLRARSEPFSIEARYRRGRPYTPLVALDELDAGPLTPHERRLVQRELIARTGSFVRFDPHDFVAVQEEAIRAWQRPASRASTAPGRWTRPGPTPH